MESTFKLENTTARNNPPNNPASLLPQTRSLQGQKPHPLRHMDIRNDPVTTHSKKKKKHRIPDEASGNKLEHYDSLEDPQSPLDRFGETHLDTPPAVSPSSDATDGFCRLRIDESTTDDSSLDEYSTGGELSPSEGRRLDTRIIEQTIDDSLAKDAIGSSARLRLSISKAPTESPGNGWKESGGRLLSMDTMRTEMEFVPPKIPDGVGKPSGKELSGSNVVDAPALQDADDDWGYMGLGDLEDDPLAEFDLSIGWDPGYGNWGWDQGAGNGGDDQGAGSAGGSGGDGGGGGGGGGGTGNSGGFGPDDWPMTEDPCGCQSTTACSASRCGCLRREVLCTAECFCHVMAGAICHNRARILGETLPTIELCKKYLGENDRGKGKICWCKKECHIYKCGCRIAKRKCNAGCRYCPCKDKEPSMIVGKKKDDSQGGYGGDMDMGGIGSGAGTGMNVVLGA